jgi:hypothetical protein
MKSARRMRMGGSSCAPAATKLLETEFDDVGRPIRTRYVAGESEHCRYDGDRLVEIDEAPGLWRTAIDPTPRGTGGRHEVEYDERRPRAIRQSARLVWERREEPWPKLLAGGTGVIAERARLPSRTSVTTRCLGARCRAAGADAFDRVNPRCRAQGICCVRSHSGYELAATGEA